MFLIEKNNKKKKSKNNIKKSRKSKPKRKSKNNIKKSRKSKKYRTKIIYKSNSKKINIIFNDENKNILLNKIKLDLKNNRSKIIEEKNPDFLESNECSNQKKINFEISPIYKKVYNKKDCSFLESKSNLYQNNIDFATSPWTEKITNKINENNSSRENITIFCNICKKHIEEINIILGVKDKLTCSLCQNILESNTIQLTDIL